MPTSGTTPRMRPMIPLTGSVCLSVCLSVSYLLSLSHFCLYMRFSVGCACACARESSRACIAVCCCVLQCVAVCCSVLQCVAVCCSVLHLSTLVGVPSCVCACARESSRACAELSRYGLCGAPTRCGRHTSHLCLACKAT